ncbi:hypothetical protein EMCRGX_G028390 [Ephydatia muelleri]
MGSSQPAMLHNLQPSTQYSFVEAACTTAGCQTGGVANVTTLDSGTYTFFTCGPSSPLILNTNSASMSLQWNAPLQPDYVITAYTLHHRVPSLKSQSEMWAPPSTATVQFHTYNPSGILFYQINSVMTDFLGVKLHGGVPWLIFLDQLSLDPTVPESSTMGYVVLFKLASNTFYITMDTVHAAAITATIVPLLTMKHVSYPLLNAPDGFDAVWVQNVGSTYIIVSWDLPTDSNGILINFSLYCNGALAGVLPLTVISYNTTGLLPFILYMFSSHSRRHCTPVGMGVISAAASLPRPYGGAYSHSPIPQLEQDVVAPGHKEHEPLAVSIPMDGELQFIGFKVQVKTRRCDQ